MSTPLWQPRSNTAARLLGLGVTAIAAAILYWQIVVTLQRANAQENDIPYSLHLIALGELFALLGLFWLATGLSGYTRVLKLQKNRRFLYTLAAVALAAIAITDYLMSSRLSALGYHS
jgi:hypothetical protein